MQGHAACMKYIGSGRNQGRSGRFVLRPFAWDAVKAVISAGWPQILRNGNLMAGAGMDMLWRWQTKNCNPAFQQGCSSHAQMERFELSHRLSQSTPLAGEPLEPLGYICLCGWTSCAAQASWRRERDSNPRCLSTSLVFKTSAFNRSAISPREPAISIIACRRIFVKYQFEGISDSVRRLEGGEERRGTASSGCSAHSRGQFPAGKVTASGRPSATWSQHRPDRPGHWRSVRRGTRLQRRSRRGGGASAARR